MESAPLVLLSNKPEGIVNIIHILKVANCIKKEDTTKKVDQADQVQVSKHLKSLILPVGFI